MGQNQFEIPTGPPPMSPSTMGPPALQPGQPKSEEPGGRRPERVRPSVKAVMIALALGVVLAYPLVDAFVKGVRTETTVQTSETPVAVATEFLEAERVGNFEVMNSLASGSEKCFGLGSLERMRSIVNKIDFKSYNLELPGNATAETEAQTDAGAVVSGVVDIGYVTTIEFTMVAESDQWRVCGFSIE